MPYYLFEMSSAPGMSLVKKLKLLKEFGSFKQARQYAHEERERLGEHSDVTIKVMFADNQLAAEEQLLEHREKPVLMEHEI